MGKKLVIPGADFSKNALVIAMRLIGKPNSTQRFFLNRSIYTSGGHFSLEGTPVDIQFNENGLYEENSIYSFLENDVTSIEGMLSGISTINQVGSYMDNIINASFNFDNLGKVSYNHLFFRSGGVSPNYYNNNLKKCLIKGFATSCSYMLEGCINLEDVDLSGLSFLDCISIGSIFLNSANIKNINFNYFNAKWKNIATVTINTGRFISCFPSISVIGATTEGKEILIAYIGGTSNGLYKDNGDTLDYIPEWIPHVVSNTQPIPEDAVLWTGIQTSGTIKIKNVSSRYYTKNS